LQKLIIFSEKQKILESIKTQENIISGICKASIVEYKKITLGRKTVKNLK